MRSQSTFVEYILIILLSISILSYTYLWFNQHKEQVIDFITKENLDRQFEIIDRFIYNFISLNFAREQFEIKSVDGNCQGNITIFVTQFRCTPSPKTLEYQGDLITVNHSVYIYSNRTHTYYPAVPLGYFVYRSCYESFYTYIINSSKCELFCKGTCNFELIKNNSLLIVR